MNKQIIWIWLNSPKAFSQHGTTNHCWKGRWNSAYALHHSSFIQSPIKLRWILESKIDDTFWIIYVNRWKTTRTISNPPQRKLNPKRSRFCTKNYWIASANTWHMKRGSAMKRLSSLNCLSSGERWIIFIISQNYFYQFFFFFFFMSNVVCIKKSAKRS